MPKSKKILIIEDEESWYVPLKTKLDHSGFKTHLETTCKSALAYFKENTQDVDLILLDINLEEKGCGLDVLKNIRYISPNIWIGVMTWSSEEYNMAAVKLNCTFISKNSEGIGEGLVELIKDLHSPTLINDPEPCNIELIDGWFITINGIQLDLPKKEQDIFRMLYKKPAINGKERLTGIYTEEEIQQYVKPGTIVDSGSVRIQISNIRKAIKSISEECPYRIILTHKGYNSYSCPFSSST